MRKIYNDRGRQFNTHLTPLNSEAGVKLDQGHDIAVSSAQAGVGGGAEDKARAGVLPNLGHLAHALDVEGFLRDQIAVTVQSPYNRFSLIGNKHKAFEQKVTNTPSLSRCLY